MSNDFEFIGGSLCLDLANACTMLCRAEPADRFSGLLRWGRQAGALSGDEQTALLRLAERHPAAATAVFHRTIRLAEAIERIFSAVAESARPAGEDLDLLNTEVADAMCCRRLVACDERFRWDWAARGAKLERILWPVAQSAADLLVSNELGRVKICHNHTCRWLFVDRSKNGRRRWCDMAVCGNRAKARRYRERQRTAS